MTQDEQVVQQLYESLKEGDAGGAAACYRDDAKFRDIAFDLEGKPRIAAMWRLVCSRNVGVEFEDIRTEGPEVRARWVADYLFRGERRVHLEIDARFTFRGGKILVHHDEASRWTWARQALGFPKAALVAAFPPILRKEAEEELRKFMLAERAA